MKRTSIVVVFVALLGVGLLYNYPSRPARLASQTKPKQLNKKERSELVYKGHNNPHSEKLRDIAAISKGEVRIERELGLPSLTPSSAPFDLQTFLTKRACDAEAIIIGKVVSGTSQLTEDGSFIYTAYEFRIDNVLKNNPSASISEGQIVTILRTGGTLELNGRRIVAQDKAAKSLEAGDRYLLFLSYLPEKTIYVADNLGYQIKHEKTIKLTEQKLQQGLESGAEVPLFTSQIRSALSVPCITASR